MIMRKNEKTPSRLLSGYTKTLFVSGVLLILPPLFCLAAEVFSQATLLTGTARYYAKMLEHILAALTLLTAGCYLTERVARQNEKDRH